MIRTVTVALRLEDSEQFDVTYHDDTHRVRLVHWNPEEPAVCTMYGARVAKNGRVNSNAVPIMNRSVDEIPPALQTALILRPDVAQR